MLDLLRGEFRLASEFHAALSGCLHPGAGSFADEAAFQFRQYANHLPHGAACRCLGVDCFRQRSEFDAALFEVVQHGYQVAQAAA